MKKVTGWRSSDSNPNPNPNPYPNLSPMCGLLKLHSNVGHIVHLFWRVADVKQHKVDLLTDEDALVKQEDPSEGRQEVKYMCTYNLLRCFILNWLSTCTSSNTLTGDSESLQLTCSWVGLHPLPSSVVLHRGGSGHSPAVEGPCSPRNSAAARRCCSCSQSLLLWY